MPRKKITHKTDETKGGYITGKLPPISDAGEVVLSPAQTQEAENVLCLRSNTPVGAKCGICLSWNFHDRLTGKDFGICSKRETFTERNSVCEKWKGQNG